MMRIFDAALQGRWVAKLGAGTHATRLSMLAATRAERAGGVQDCRLDRLRRGGQG